MINVVAASSAQKTASIVSRNNPPATQAPAPAINETIIDEAP